MRYACLVYNDGSKIAHLSEAEQLTAILAECEAAVRWRAEMESSGHLVFSAGLEDVRSATTVRKADGKLALTDGPFAETKEFLGGFSIIEARDLNEALQLASKLASELMTVEVRPVLDAKTDHLDPSHEKIAAALQERPR
jgi:hypothetical protein